MIKHSLFPILLAFLLCKATADAQISPDEQKFFAKRTAWLNVLPTGDKPDTTDLSEIEARGLATTKEWEALPPGTRAGVAPSIYLWWFETASVAADRGNYQKALEYYNREMSIRYATGSLLRHKGRSFVLTAIRLEADIVGHLGLRGYPTAIDHFLLPVELRVNGMKAIVAMEETADDDQNGVEIPPRPEGKDRKILYLLTADRNGKYQVVDSVQLIGRLDKGTRITVGQSGGIPLLALGGISDRVIVKNGIPIKYVPVRERTIRYAVTVKGLEETP